MNKYTSGSGIQLGNKEGKVYSLVENPKENAKYTGVLIL